MRGKDALCNDAESNRGITPAYAGKSHTCSIGFPALQDHPRVCGEKPVAMHSCITSRGSSPRVRGKVCTAEHDERQPGIIPAYAGKRRSDWIIRSIYWDHPRVCGEKCRGVPAATLPPGSPPRMRGKAPALLLFGACIGITPAHAGKRLTVEIRLTRHKDHPRVCGEKCFCRAILSNESGSPPRMRGKAEV